MQDIPSRAEVIINVTLTDDPAEDNFENVTITALADLKAVVCPVVRAPPTPAEEAAKDAAAKRAAAVRRMAAARRPLSSTVKHAQTTKSSGCLRARSTTASTGVLHCCPCSLSVRVCVMC